MKFIKYFIFILSSLACISCEFNNSTTVIQPKQFGINVIEILEENKRITEELNMVEAITVYKNYYLQENGKLFGISKDGLKEINTNNTLKDFFKKDECLYFTIEETKIENEEQIEVIKHYKQNGTKVEEIESLPIKPTIEEIPTYYSDNFDIHENTYENLPVVDIIQHSMNGGIARFIKLNGFCEIENKGLYYQVKVLSGSKDVGLYLWEYNRSSHSVKTGAGEIW